MADVKKTLEELIAHTAGVDAGRRDAEAPRLMKPETRLDEDLGLDLLDRTELAIDINAAFSVELPDDAEFRWKTIADIYADVRTLTGRTDV